MNSILQTPSESDTSEPIRDPARKSRIGKVARRPVTWLTLCLLVAAGCFWFGLRDTDKSTQVPANTAASAKQLQYETKAIQDIREGDIVLARDEFGNDLGMKRVVEVYERTSDHLRILTFRSPEGTSQTLKTTNEHPFWVESRNTFVDAGDLRIGDTVTGPRGELQIVALTVYEPHPDGIPVYNFQVEDYHTYFVKENGARAPPVLVHNANYRDALGRFTSSAGGHTATASRGIAAHRNYRNALGNKYRFEVKLPSGKRADAVDFDNRIVRELKPNNPRAIQDGKRQLERYRKELQNEFGGKWTSHLDTYNP